MARAEEALGDIDCVERGYLLIPQAIECFERGEPAEALARFETASDLAERFGDADLAAFANMGRGQALIALGDQARATVLLDTAMVAVCAGEVSPMMAGLVYCGAIEACQEMVDPQRALEWTGALSRWWNVADARVAANELREIAADVGTPLLQAHAAHAHGAVMLAEDGAAGTALPVLRAAWSIWRRLAMPYEAARVRVLIGLACRALGDTDGADMEFDAARLGFERLGAHTDLRRLATLAVTGNRLRNGLTDREVEVLMLVAEGLTNRQIGSALVVSEHTVARHLQNVFAKLQVSSRTAASTYAKEHGLL